MIIFFFFSFMETFLLSIILLLDLLSIELSINRDNDENQIILRHGGKNRKKIFHPIPSFIIQNSCYFQKSIQLAKKISSINSRDDFLKLVKDVPKDISFFSSSSRMGETERSNAERPNQALCMPELQTVPLLENEPSVIYYPTCTRIKRCGGCCTHSLLSCQPTATEIRNFEILVTILESSGKLKYQGKRIVPIEEHTQCTCDCKIKETDCNKKQSYVPEECTCACNNVDEQKKCNESNIKMWHPDLCSCFCRETQECSTGFYFDQNSCRCLQVPLSRTWFTSTKGSDYRFGQTQRPDNVPPVIIALDSDDPRRKPKPDPE